MTASLLPTDVKIKAHHHQLKLMGCRFVLTAVHHNPQIAWDGIRAGVAEIQRIEDLISSWKSDSQTTLINQNAGIRPVKVDPELWQLIRRSLQVSQLTAGAFDISGTLSRYYWKFDGKEHDWLPQEKIEELRDRINYRLIHLDEEAGTVYLAQKGMKIGFGGIGKGYAAFRAGKIMQELGIADGLINAAGDLMCWGKPPKKEYWDIHIPAPEEREESVLQITIPNGSVVTSGDYESYTILNGKRYSHIVDPRTGLPVESLRSVSVICPNPELGDALATAISVLGIQSGIQLIDRLNGIECMIIDQNNQAHYSTQLKNYFV